jgi:uncharacterized protein YciI
MTYLVLTRRTPNFRTDVLEEHYGFLQKLRDAGQLDCAGPFSDGSGGAYILRANSLDDAGSIALCDPLRIAGCSDIEVYEWNPS